MFKHLKKFIGANREQKVNTGKFYLDMDNKHSLKNTLSAIPNIKCPNPECMKGPIIEKEKPDNTLIYLEDNHIYYCSCCERSYKYEELSNNMLVGFDDEGVDVSQSTDNPVNDELKSNTIIRMFDHTKGNKVNIGNKTKYQREQSIRELYETEITKQYAKDNHRIDPV